MLAPVPKRRRRRLTAREQERFAAMLPAIERHASIEFRREPASQREELISEVVGNSFVAFVRLVERGLIDVAYAGPLAAYAVKHVRAGRYVGTPPNVNDVGSVHCQKAKGVTVRSLDFYDPAQGEAPLLVLDWTG